MKTGGGVGGAIALAAWVALGAPPVHGAGAAQGGFEKAQGLFQKNRWAEARAEIKASWSSIAEKDRGQATFLVGRSYVLEAEFYRALRRWGSDVGMEYLGELASAKENQNIPWLGLFTGLYSLQAGDDRGAERALAAAARSGELPEPWKALARRRAGVARHRLGKPTAPDTPARDSSYEASYWRVVLDGLPPPASLPAAKARGPEPFLGACVLFRARQERLAEAMLHGLDPDRPDVEEERDPNKILRFFDPIVSEALERIAWERAVIALRPLAESGKGLEGKLAAYYTGLSLYFLGDGAEATAFLAKVDPVTVGPDVHGRAQVLTSAVRGKPVEMASLWESTRSEPETVLLWKELERPGLASAKPFSGALAARLAQLPRSFPPRPSGSMVGAWGLAQLGGGADAAEVLQVLSRFRNHANKNKLEANAPLLLLALSAANYENSDYAQALETIFELSKTFKGLRALQWNLQGVYVARHEAAGEARISR